MRVTEWIGFVLCGSNLTLWFSVGQFSKLGHNLKFASALKSLHPIIQTYRGKPWASNFESRNISLVTFLYLCRQIRKKMSNLTFTMIKPDAMKNKHAGVIIDRFIKEGFRIVALKQTRLTEEKAGEFYAIHKARPFYGELVSFMSSGPVIAIILEKANAVSAFRELIGATDPSKAAEKTIRKLYATSLGENAVHGSDSDENAKIESDFFFSALERY